MNGSESVAKKLKLNSEEVSPSKKAQMEKDTLGSEDKYAYLKLPQDPRPDVYTQKPSQPKEKKPGQLTPEQLDHFFDKGFVLVKDYFDKTLLDKAREAIKELVDELANVLYSTGKIKNKHEDKGFFQRLTYLNKEYPGAAVVMHKLGTLPKEFCDLWTWENLLNAVEQIIGPDIAGHPVWNLRTKTPRNEEVTVPWHQDNAYLEPCALNAMQLTAWIPMLDTNKLNGCMLVASGGHKKGITATHTCCAGGTWYVDLAEEEMTNTLGVDMEKDLVLCEVPYGGVLFLNNAIPHKSLDNKSDQIRWSIDLRWQKPDVPNGFYGLRKNILMRSSDNPNLKPDWSEIIKEHTYKWAKTMMKAEDDERLVPVICGPWMHRWELVHLNKHTEPLTEDLLNCKWHVDKA